MAKKRSTPGAWFVTQDELKFMLYAIASDYNALKARVTLLESELAEAKAPAGVSNV